MALLLPSFAPPTTAAFRLDDAWVEPARAGATTRAFVSISSLAAMPLAIGSVASPVARHIRLAGQSATSAGLAARGGFIVPANASLNMHPGGAWLELAGLTTDLNTGERIRLALAFPGEMTVWVEVEVRATRLAIQSYSQHRSA